MLIDLCDHRLIEFLQGVNSGRQQELPTEELKQAEAYIDALFQASTRLAVYGTLAPGEVNDWVLKPLQGVWSDSFVRGRLYPPGSWGSGIKYPGFRWEPYGSLVNVKVFESSALEFDWERLDAFEGEEYQRILVLAEIEAGTVQIANLYSMRI